MRRGRKRTHRPHGSLGSSSESLQIAGAGPAGLSAALLAVQAGRNVVVYEAGKGVGGRFHDDFQGLENWTTAGDVLAELAAIGVEATFEHKAVHEVTAFEPTGRAHVVRSAEPLFYLVRRGPGPGTLDRGLYEQAVRKGVDIRFGRRLDHFAGGGLVATGPRRADVIAAGYVFETNAADGAYVAFGNDLASSGYAYLLVAANRATLAVCLFDRFHQEKRFLERSVAFFEARVGIKASNAKFFGGAGNFLSQSSGPRGAVLEAGEAAGFQDALWGFGLRYAVLSGALAARALLEGLDYELLWKSRLGGAMRSSLVNRFLLERSGDRGCSHVLRRVSGADPRRYLRRLYAPSVWKSLLKPLADRQLFAASRPGVCTAADCDCVWCRCQREFEGEDLRAPHATRGPERRSVDRRRA